MYKFAMPVVQGRGAGLGNELIVWAKAFLGSQITGAQLLHPAWGLNKRRYWRFFGTSRADFIGHAMLRRTLPFFSFTEEDLRRSPEPGLEAAIRHFAEVNRLDERGAYVLGFSGMWGGIGSLSGAREFVRSVLLGAKHTLPNLYRAEQRIGPGKIRIGLHVRRGDFGEVPDLEAMRGRFNVALPLDWYIRTARSIYERLGDSATFVVVSDASPSELRPLTDAVPCVTTSEESETDISDMLLLSSCDFIICSVSSFSVWAAFLSNGRYGWFAPNLVEHEGYLSIWGHEPWQMDPRGETARARRLVSERIRTGEQLYPRGIPIGLNGIVPDDIVNDLLKLKDIRDRSCDIICYGTVPGDTRI